jgi:hypothetical protein
MYATSIAIWNKDKVIMAIAIGAWVINVVSLIVSESHCPLPTTGNLHADML